VPPVPSVQSGLTTKAQGLLWLLRKLGPYVALEILMPGGTLLALLLFLYRRRNGDEDAVVALRAAGARMLDEMRRRAAPVRVLCRLRASV
jgi:hypothetical protein